MTLLVALLSRDSVPRAARNWEPSIEFMTVPEAGPAGPTGSRQSAAVSPAPARVSRSSCLQRAVCGGCSRSPSGPSRQSKADSTWKNTIHLGTEYAALLVEPGIAHRHDRDAARAGRPGHRGGDGQRHGRVRDRPRKTLIVQRLRMGNAAIPSDRGGDNEYDPDNAWTDATGIPAPAPGAAGRKMDERGSHQHTVAGLRHLIVRACGTPRSSTLPRRRPADLGRAGCGAKPPGAGHRNQPVGRSHDQQRAVRGAAVLRPGQRHAVCRAARTAHAHVSLGAGTRDVQHGSRRSVIGGSGPVVAEHEFTAGVPMPGTERVRMNLYFFRYSPEPPRSDVEVVIERFQYLP